MLFVYAYTQICICYACMYTHILYIYIKLAQTETTRGTWRASAGSCCCAKRYDDAVACPAPPVRV